MGVLRVVGNIKCVGAGKPSSRPVRDANSASPKDWQTLQSLDISDYYKLDLT